MYSSMDEEEAVLLLALDEVGYLRQVTKMYAVSIEKSSQYKKIFIFYFICRKKDVGFTILIKKDLNIIYQTTYCEMSTEATKCVQLHIKT